MNTTPKEDGTTEVNMDSILRRLKKLLALATDPAAAPGEAENAMRMAQALMRKHKVSNLEMATSEIGETMFQSTKATAPPVHENALMWQLMRAFGAKFFWMSGRGPKGMRDKGYYAVVAEKGNCELIKYAFEVVMRQMNKARASYVATMPTYWTRPRKAADADAFCVAFVHALAKKITDFSGQDPLITQAIANRVTEATKHGKRIEMKPIQWSSRAIEEGTAAGEKATLHRSVSSGPKRERVAA